MVIIMLLSVNAGLFMITRILALLTDLRFKCCRMPFQILLKEYHIV